MKNIWLWNHYATNMFRDRGGRHYWFAENLIKRGYKVTIFCASTIHNSTDNIDTGDRKYATDVVNGIPFVFVKTSHYVENGKKRIENMITFYKNLFPVAKEYAKMNGRPDTILASSVHPLTLVAGIKIAKKFRVPCICEVRDLWPESFVAYGIIKKSNPLLKLLYAGEKWIYKKANKLIFTMEGGKDYIIEKGWDKVHGGSIDINKVYHINNGVDLEVFNYNKKHYILDDKDLEENKYYKVVYVGSLRQANKQIWKLFDAIKLMHEPEYENIKFLIYGDGSERKKIEKYCKDNGLRNVYIKGYVEKKYIPYILTRCDLNILNCTFRSILKYGGCQNKLFDYLASENPIITGDDSKYCIVKNRKCGIAKNFKDATELKQSILELKNLNNVENNELKKNILKAAYDYDFKNLTEKLIDIIERNEVEQ